MSSTTWRNLCIAFALLSAWLGWRGGCGRRIAKPTPEQCAKLDDPRRSAAIDIEHSDDNDDARSAKIDGAPANDGGGFSAFGFKAPAWVAWFAPKPGEDMLAYRDRMVPLAQAAVAPHRNRVAKSRDNLAQQIGLDSRQRAELDAAVDETASAITDRVLNGFLGGEFSPSTFKPMTGIAAAKDILDAIDRGNRRFLMSLREDQRSTLAAHPFDFADYMVFSHRWEEALGIAGPPK